MQISAISHPCHVLQCPVVAPNVRYASPMTCSNVSTVSELQIGSCRPLSSPHCAYSQQTTPLNLMLDISAGKYDPRRVDVPSVTYRQLRTAPLVSTVTNENSLDSLLKLVSRFHSFSSFLVRSDYHLPRQ